MKITCIIIMLLICTSHSYSKDNTNLQKGCMLIDGDFTAKYSKHGQSSYSYMQFSLTPSVGYFITDNFVPLIITEFNTVWPLQSGFQDAKTGFLLGAGARYYAIESIINPHIEIAILFDRSNTKSKYLSYRTSLGLDVFITESVAIEPSILYQYQDALNSAYYSNYIIAKIGLAFFKL